MEINSKIIEILKETKIPVDDGICYLISLHHNHSPSYIPNSLKQDIIDTGIIRATDTGLVWRLPLYKGGTTNFDWVKDEYITLFKQKNPDKGGKVREATARMKKLFASNPEIRKDEVLGATRMYMNSTDPRFIRFPHYFIEKGVGANKTYDILDWLEKYKLSTQSIGKSIGTSNTMK